MDIPVKQEATETANAPPVSIRNGGVSLGPGTIIELSSSDSDSSSSDSDDGAVLGGEPKRPRVLDVLAEASSKRTKLDAVGDVLPPGFLDVLPLAKALSPTSVVMRLPAPSVEEASQQLTGVRASGQSSKQFWKAGDYEGTPAPSGDLNTRTGGMDHVRVHPKFLHSNATSHKWVLGAFAELLDNSLDEVGSGATFVNIDKRENKKDGSRMLVIEDNGGGMDPEKMRHCMSLGYSAKSKEANTIGQYGNGFKTSTMRLGADVIVFSRCSGKDGKSLTQSIGLLSYTFLRSTGKEDIVVPMLDYERGSREWKKIIRSSSADWNRTVETIVQWSPFSSEADLLREFYLMKEHGTRIIIYNLWEDDQGQMELDFDTDPHDIQIRGVNRDEKNIQMAKQYPNSWHFLTYRHSLRSYASILYLRLPPGFRIILRGKDVEHHNIVNDMMMSEEVTYRPQPGADGVLKDSNMVASVTIGFVKDAKYHIDVQGFNVYHKNRLIKPFWRIWNAAGSDGRGVIGVLEANFVEPAHDKQGFERTIVLSRLETRLIQMQKNYWSSNCQKIGYAPRRSKKLVNESADRESSPEYCPQTSPHSKRQHTASSSKTSDKFYSPSNQKWGGKELGSSKILDRGSRNRQASSKGTSKMKVQIKSQKRPSSSGPSSPYLEDVNDDDVQIAQSGRPENGSSHEMYAERLTPDMEVTEPQQDCTSGGIAVLSSTRSQSKVHHLNENACSPSNSDLPSLDKLREENRELRKRLQGTTDAEIFGQLLRDLQLERDRCKNLESELQAAKQKIGDSSKKDEDLKEQENLVLLLLEERDRLKKEEDHLRNKLKDASNTIQELLDKVKVLEKMKSPNSKG